MQQGSGGSGASGLKGIGVLLLVVGIVGGLIAAIFGGRLLAEQTAATIYSLADGREAWTVVLTMAGPLLAALAGLVLLHRGRGHRIAGRVRCCWRQARDSGTRPALGSVGSPLPRFGAGRAVSSVG